MAVEELLASLKNRQTNRTPQLIGGVGPKYKPPVAAPQDNGLRESIGIRRAKGSTFLNNYRNQEITKLATDVVDKSAGRIQTNEFGIPVRTPTKITDQFNEHSRSINQIGKSALQAEEGKAAWQNALRNQNLGSYGVVPDFDMSNMPAGSSKDNIGGKAVAIAMTAYKNRTPYVWGGNSLFGGVDCSGLVQQVYNKLGINLPRTTYEQAKSGKVVSMNNLMPGDLIFYNTGRRDPNGIGSLSHVAIYIGNGMVLEAPGKGKNVQRNKIGTSGTPAKAVRPW